MQRIVTAITAMALALSIFGFTAQSAAAVTGYDSAYFGESAFLTLPAGSTGQFVAIFTNTGATGWTTGTSTQVNLAVCLADKTTCNVASPNAAWNPGTWLSSTAYATTSTSFVGPGQQGFFVYNVKAPAAGGGARFNGDLSLAATGSMIHPQGYYQDAFSPGATGAAAVLTSMTPTTGTTAGGTTVTITGTGFVCTPSFPAVTFGTAAATVTSCGTTTLVVTSPAGTAGSANVVVTNTGAAASNALAFTYADLTKPTFNSVTAQDSIATATFSEAVCNPAALSTAGADWTVTVNGAADAVTADSIPTCDSLTAATNGVTTANLFLTTAVPNGAFVAVTLNQSGTTGTNTNIQDAAGNFAVAPRSNTATATAAETTAPTLVSASGTTGSSTVTLTFSEPVWCAGAFPASQATITSTGTPITVTAITCPNSAATASTTFTLTTSAPLAASTTYTVTLTTTAGNEVKDVVGNNMASPASATFTTTAADTTAPTITDARVTRNVLSTDLTDSGDAFTLTFSEKMAAPTAASTIQLTDSDGTVATITCSGAGTSSATCALDTTGTILTVTLTGTLATTGGSITGLQLPATVTAATGITDLAGNAVNLPGSADRVVN